MSEPTPITNDDEKKTAIAGVVAGMIFGGVLPNSNEWHLCESVASALTGGIALDNLKYRGTNAAFHLCRDFNKKCPVGTRGVFTEKNVETESHVESKAMVFPSVTRGDKVMAWFRGVGWRDVTEFTAKPLQITPSEHAVSLAQQARANQQSDVARIILLGALAADGGCWQAHNELGVIYQERNDWTMALNCFETAESLHPNDLTLLANIGTAHRSLGNDDEAEVAFHKVLAVDPGNVHVLLHMAALMADHGMLSGALANYDRVLSRVPTHETALYQRSLVLLAAMDFERGWDAFQCRLFQKSSIAHYEHFVADPFFVNPRRPNDTDHVLVWTEQGLGDEILMCTMLPSLIATGAKVTLLCSERLVPLMRRSFPTITVGQRPFISFPEMMERKLIPDKHLPPEARQEFTMQMSMSDLGKAFRSSVRDFPNDDAGVYLNADPQAANEFYRSLRDQYPGKWLVGLSWESPKNIVIGTFKGVSLAQMRPILNAPNAVFVNLQYGDKADEVERFAKEYGLTIHTDPSVDQMQDMDRCAALVSALDLVVTVSNTTAHVACAVGVPTMMLTPAGPGAHWYWHHEYPTVPWYSELTLFRQEHSLKWDSAIDELAERLREQCPPEGPQ